MLTNFIAPKASSFEVELRIVRLICSGSWRSPVHKIPRRNVSHRNTRAVPSFCCNANRERSILRPGTASRKRTTHTQATAEMSVLVGDTFYLDEFAFRQFEGGHAAQLDVPKEEFVQTVHKLYHEGRKLVDGYAPFCKHLFVPNFTSANLNALPITKDNEDLLKTAYSRRRPEELAVLTRWFPKERVKTQKAKYLDLILYSREQLTKEYFDRPDQKFSHSQPDAPWGIISIKPQTFVLKEKTVQDEDYETPMQPITVMRNSLGRSEGGSGVSLDREAYEASVKYWETHASVIDGSPSGE